MKFPITPSSLPPPPSAPPSAHSHTDQNPTTPAQHPPVRPVQADRARSSVRGRTCRRERRRRGLTSITVICSRKNSRSSITAFRLPSAPSSFDLRRDNAAGILYESMTLAYVRRLEKWSYKDREDNVLPAIDKRYQCPRVLPQHTRCH